MQHDFTEKDLEDPRVRRIVLGKEIAEEYVKYRRMTHPKYELSTRWDKCWDKVATVLLRNSWSPGAYIRAQFIRPDKTFVPAPNVLYNAQAERNMLDSLEVTPVDEWVQKVQSDIDFYTSRMKAFGNPAEILEMTQAHFSPVFKWLMSYHHRNDGCDPEKYRVPALFALTNPAIEKAFLSFEAFKKLLPAAKNMEP